MESKKGQGQERTKKDVTSPPNIRNFRAHIGAEFVHILEFQVTEYENKFPSFYTVSKYLCNWCKNSANNRLKINRRDFRLKICTWHHIHTEIQISRGNCYTEITWQRALCDYAAYNDLLVKPNIVGKAYIDDA